jgi:hypothetical protein
VTKRFYDRFKTEHAAFLLFVKGIRAQGDREWYASLMLNRLMFVYFIQKKGFLDGDVNYLRNRLHMMRAARGKDQFHSFYRHFLLRLFHEGLGSDERTPELDMILGKVPYLDGGLFDVHVLERENDAIHIADEAFEKIFAFFDAYSWHLDERPLHADNEINPDVLGYIFEKVHQSAYYAKEDITEYIAQNCILPCLLDTAERQCAVAFEQAGALWRLVREDPDRYIYAAVRKGVELDLPTPTCSASLSGQGSPIRGHAAGDGSATATSPTTPRPSRSCAATARSSASPPGSLAVFPPASPMRSGSAWRPSTAGSGSGPPRRSCSWNISWITRLRTGSKPSPMTPTSPSKSPRTPGLPAGRAHARPVLLARQVCRRTGLRPAPRGSPS